MEFQDCMTAVGVLVVIAILVYAWAKNPANKREGQSRPESGRATVSSPISEIELYSRIATGTYTINGQRLAALLVLAGSRDPKAIPVLQEAAKKSGIIGKAGSALLEYARDCAEGTPKTPSLNPAIQKEVERFAIKYLVEWAASGKVLGLRALWDLSAKGRDNVFEFLEKGGKNVQQQVIDLLREVNYQPGGDLQAARYYWYTGQTDKLAALGEPALDLLKRRLKEGDSQAVRILGEMNNAAGFRALVEGLEQYPLDIRKAALEELDKHNYLPDPELEAKYAWSAGKDEKLVGMGERAIDFLNEKLDSKSERAVNLLAGIGTARALDMLAERMNLEEKNRSLCRKVARALKDSGWKAGGHPKEALFYWMSGQKDMLVRMKDKAVPLLSSVFTPQPEEIAPMLTEIGSEAAASSLILKLDHPARNVRQAAARALAAGYQDGSFEIKAKAMILAAQKKITRRHEDRHDHEDYETNHEDGYETRASDCGGHTDQSSHMDGREHIDKGIGVDFPL